MDERASGELTVVDGVRRQYDYWLIVVKRTWRGQVFSSFLSPILFVVAMGVLLGGFIESDPEVLEGATSYLSFLAPGLVAVYAMQAAVGETTYPVMSMIKWQRIYESMLATPLQARHLVAGHLGFAMFRVAITSGVFIVVLIPFGVYEAWWSPLACWLGPLLTGACFGSLIYGVTARMHNEQGLGVIYRILVMPLFLFSGAFFPVANLGDVGGRLAQVTPLWHGVNLTRMLAIDQVDWGVAALNVGVLTLLTVVGVRWSVTGLTKRLVS